MILTSCCIHSQITKWRSRSTHVQHHGWAIHPACHERLIGVIFEDRLVELSIGDSESQAQGIIECLVNTEMWADRGGYVRVIYRTLSLCTLLQLRHFLPLECTYKHGRTLYLSTVLIMPVIRSPSPILIRRGLQIRSQLYWSSNR